MKFPTGGISDSREEPASACFGRVSRSGEMPEPTVTVRMGENKAFRKPHLGSGFVAPVDRFYAGTSLRALILELKRRHP